MRYPSKREVAFDVVLMLRKRKAGYDVVLSDVHVLQCGVEQID